MGMFDWIECELPLPDGFKGEGLQTKSLNCALEHYVITVDGKLKKRDDYGYCGTVRFYGTGDDGGWHEYVAEFYNGDLRSLTLVKSDLKDTRIR
jgi:hypothetical protein